jgi:hypothetical protein
VSVITSVPELLALLVSLAGDDDDVARLGCLDRVRDCRAPVLDDLRVAVDARKDLVDDGAGVLAARVVGRDDWDIGELGGDPAHDRALLAVAVATAAEDADQAARCELARGREHVLERVGRVRVVDEHRERLPLVDGLETSGHAVDRFQPARDRVVIDPEQATARYRRKRVLHVEAALELEIDSVERFGPNLRLLGEAVGQRVGPLLRELASPRVADVDRRGRSSLDEEPALRLEVRLHRPVQVEVVLGQVRERERGEADPVEAPELGAVRRRLHRGAAVARVEHLAERALEVDRLGCGANCRPCLAADS